MQTNIKQRLIDLGIISRHHYIGHSGNHLFEKIDVELLAAQHPLLFEQLCHDVIDRAIAEHYDILKTIERVVGIAKGGILMIHPIWSRLVNHCGMSWLKTRCIYNGKPTSFTPSANEQWLVADDVFTTGTSITELEPRYVRLVLTLFRWDTGIDLVAHIPNVSLHTFKQELYNKTTCPNCSR